MRQTQTNGRTGAGTRCTSLLSAPTVAFPRCTLDETYILQLRGQGFSFRQIEEQTGIAPRLASDLYFSAMKKIVAYLETDAFLRGVQ